MYYVIKVYKHTTPLIVETFDDLNDALDYVRILTKSNKGNFTVLTDVAESVGA